MLSPAPRPVAFSLDVYGLLLRLYPSVFRRRFRQEALQVFAADCGATYAAGGRKGIWALWLRALPDVLRCALGEHVAEWLAEHPAQHLSARRQAAVTGALALAVVAVFLADMNTPPETPMAITYACVLFAAGALLPPLLAAVIGGSTLGVYIVDGWMSPHGWTAYRVLGLAALLVAGLWALRTGAEHARLRARASKPVTAQTVGAVVSPDEAIRVLRSLVERAPSLKSEELTAALRDTLDVLETAQRP